MNSSEAAWLAVVFVLGEFVALGIASGACKSGTVAGFYVGFTCDLTEIGVGSIPPDCTALSLRTKETEEMGNVTLPSLPLLKVLEYDVTRGLDVSQGGPFHQLPDLESLQLLRKSLPTSSSDDFRFALQAGIFQGLGGLRRLILSDLGLEDLPAGVFDGLDNLRILELNENRLSAVPDGTFAACCQSLSMLTLSRNRISDVGHVSKRGLSGLKTLDLSTNRLTALTELDFVGLDNILSIDLANNEVERIEEESLRRLTKLESLHLNGNRLRFSAEESVSNTTSPTQSSQGSCRGPFCGLSWLQMLDVSNNYISRFPAQTFRDLVSLTKLDISRNSIDNLLYEHFACLQSLEELDLNGNHIMTLDRAFRRTFNRLTLVDLSSNPWHCDCDIYWLARLDIELNNVEGTQCSTPIRDQLLTEAYANRTGECESSEDTTTLYDEQHRTKCTTISLDETTESVGFTESTADENTKVPDSSLLPEPENIRLPGEKDITTDDDHISTKLTSGLHFTSDKNSEQTTLQSVTQDIQTLENLLVTEIANVDQTKTCDVLLSSVTENMKTLDSLLQKTTANIDTLNTLLTRTISTIEIAAERTTKSPEANEHRRNLSSVTNQPNVSLHILSILLTVSGILRLVGCN